MLNNYDEVLDFLRKDNSGKALFSGSKSDDLIAKAEYTLSIKFSPMYKKFLNKLGAGSYCSFEILGVIDYDFEESCVPDGIWYTLNERKLSNLPNNLMVISETGDGDLYCQDYSNMDELEPKIIMYSPGIDHQNQKYEVVANNFGDFLLEKLNMVI